MTAQETSLCRLALTAWAIRCDREEAEMRALSDLFGVDDPAGSKALRNAEASKQFAAESRDLAKRL